MIDLDKIKKFDRSLTRYTISANPPPLLREKVSEASSIIQALCDEIESLRAAVSWNKEEK